MAQATRWDDMLTCLLPTDTDAHFCGTVENLALLVKQAT